VRSSAPDKARAIAESVGKIVPAVKEPADKLRALSALVIASAAADDLASFRDNLNKCFALGEELFEEDSAAHPSKPTYLSEPYDVLRGLLPTGVELDRLALASSVDHIRNTALKAYLLEGFAEALYRKGLNSESQRSQVPKEH
jgi:hypothetical protein